MSKIISKEEFTSKLQELINNNDLQDNVSWYYASLAREFRYDLINVSDFLEVFEKLISNRIAEIYNLKDKDVFLSIPITGKEEKARKTCDAIKKRFEKYFPTCTLYVPFDVAPDKDKPDSYYMGKDIEKLMECDIMIQMNDWEKSKGCTVENCVADVYGIPKISIDKLFIEEK